MLAYPFSDNTLAIDSPRRSRTRLDRPKPAGAGCDLPRRGMVQKARAFRPALFHCAYSCNCLALRGPVLGGGRKAMGKILLCVFL